MIQALRIVQLSDPHLVGDPQGRVRHHTALLHWDRALAQAVQQRPDLVLISGDCCQDESWNGYALLRDSLSRLPPHISIAVLPGNHDHPTRLRAALGRKAALAPAVISLGRWDLVLLSSHWSGQTAGQIGTNQLIWLQTILNASSRTSQSLLVGLHHPPIPVGDPSWDRMGLRDWEPLVALLQAAPTLKAVVFGHLHQPWQGTLPMRPDVPLLGCPSTLCAFPALQACYEKQDGQPCGRLLDLSPNGTLTSTLLHWPDQPDP